MAHWFKQAADNVNDQVNLRASQFNISASGVTEMSRETTVGSGGGAFGERNESFQMLDDSLCESSAKLGEQPHKVQNMMWSRPVINGFQEFARWLEQQVLGLVHSLFQLHTGQL